MSVVSAKNLSKYFKKEVALKSLSFEIKPGKITGLIGADGAGKSTLIRILSALLDYRADELTVLGYDVKKNPADIQELIGYMPQKFGLYEDLTVKENMYLYADLQSIPKENRTKRVEELLEFTTLTNFQNSSPPTSPAV